MEKHLAWGVFCRIAFLLALTQLRIVAASAEDRPQDIVLSPFIGDYYWLVEAYLRVEGDFTTYLGPITSMDIFGGFTDVDGDGRDEFLAVVDNKLTCDGSVCDFFIFAPVVHGRDVETPCDWQLVDDRPKPVARGLYERFVTVDGQSVALASLAAGMPCTLNGIEWEDYFHFVYDTAHYTGSEKIHEHTLNDIRLGTYDINDDGEEEVFVYITPVQCPLCSGWGHVFEIIRDTDGAIVDWRSRGKFGSLDPVPTTIGGDPTFLAPSATIHVTGEIVDGHRSLCTSNSILRWNGKAYEPHVFLYLEAVREEARALGCLGAASAQSVDDPVHDSLDE